MKAKLWFRSAMQPVTERFQFNHPTFGVTNFKKYRAMWPWKYWSNNAAESLIARNNSVFVWSEWLPKIKKYCASMETLANWLFVSENQSANKYTFPASENKLCAKKHKSA